MSLVLDASALLALLHDEPGAELVKPVLEGARVSTVNWAEVVQKSLARGVDTSWMRNGFSDIGVIFEPFTSSQAEIAAALWMSTRSRALSLADRACLALALELGLPALTADRAWADLEVEVELHFVR